MWFLLTAIFGVVAYQLAKTKDKKYRPLTLKAGEEVVVRTGPTALQLLDRAVGLGRKPPLPLLRAAYHEATASGNPALVKMVKAVAKSWVAPQEQVGVGQVQPSTEEQSAWTDNPPPDADGDPESWGELANPAQAPAVAVVTTPRCPIDGVDPSKWASFCEALRTRKPAWGSDSHLGAWEHRKTRLRQLGIDPDTLATEDAQYEALCRDISDYNHTCNQLVRDFAGTEVQVADAKHPVTPSGVLGLLKAAGPKGAEGWLRNPGDRTKFPRTTEVFLRCNGTF